MSLRTTAWVLASAALLLCAGCSGGPAQSKAAPPPANVAAGTFPTVTYHVDGMT